jgi:hypothetical protein
MVEDKGKKTLGIVLIALGSLFLLVNLNFLWFGWEAVWPFFPFLIGILMMKLYATQRRPPLLFGGLVLTQLGLFFFLFTAGVAPWPAMEGLWPFLILIPGIASLAVAATGGHGISSLIVGLVAVAVAVVGFWAARGNEGARVLAPLMRFWPIVLIVAGIMIYNRARGRPPGPEEVNKEAPGPAPPVGSS